jgi:hypothetical protein
VRSVSLFIAALAITAGGYLAGFSGARLARGHFTHCDPGAPWTTNPCNGVPGGLERYYAAQIGNTAYLAGYSNGIDGFISAQDVAIHDIQNDFIANWIGVANLVGEWVQPGFWEGIMPNGAQRTTPQVYNETMSACQAIGYSFAERSTPPGNPRYNEYFRVSWHGSYGYCANPVAKVYIWQYGRGAGFATFDYGFMFTMSGRFDATTELRDRTHMEPSGTQCFGGGYLCTPSEYGFDLFLWKQSDQTWYLWDASRPTTIVENEVAQGFGSGYFHNPSQQHYRFTTTSGWQ